MSRPAAAAGEKRGWNIAVLLGAAALIGIAIGGVYFYRLWVKSRTPIQSVVVLPFLDQTPQKDRQWLCDGITDEIIDLLARTPGLHVVGRDSAFAVRNQQSDVQHIAEQFGVGAVLEGQVNEAGGRVRITVQLSRPADAYQFWAQAFERQISDLRVVEEDIAGQIVKRVPGARGWKPAKPRHTAGAEAYQAYLEGRSWFGRGGQDALRKAIERFEKATQSDPLFAQAWAWLSISKTYLVEEDAEPPNGIMPGARDAAERGATLDPDLSEPHAAVGMVMLQYDRYWEDAKREFDRAIELSPGSALARNWRARWYQAMNRGEEALTALQQALAIDPLSPQVLGNLALERLRAGQADRAMKPAEKDGSVKLGEWWTKTIGITAEEARATLGRVEELRTTKFTPADTFAMMAAAIGDKNAFFEWADVAYDERSPHLAYWRLLPGLPVSDPRFRELMQRMNLPETTRP